MPRVENAPKSTGRDAEAPQHETEFPYRKKNDGPRRGSWPLFCEFDSRHDCGGKSREGRQCCEKISKYAASNWVVSEGKEGSSTKDNDTMDKSDQQCVNDPDDATGKVVPVELSRWAHGGIGENRQASVVKHVYVDCVCVWVEEQD